MARGRKHREPDTLGPRLFKRGRWWCADLRPWGLGRPTLRDPKAAGFPHGGERTTLADVARRWVNAYLDLAEDTARTRQLHQRPKGQTVDAVTRQYLGHREKQVEPSTYYNDVTATKYLAALAGPKDLLASVTQPKLQEFFDERIAAGYAPGGLESLRLSMSAFFRWLGGPNPAKGIVIPERQPEEVHAWTDAEIERLRDAADAVDVSRENVPPSARLFVEVALGTGARIQELFALEWRDFNPDAKTVRIYRQAVPTGKGLKQLKSKRARVALVLPDWWDHYQPDATGWVLHNAPGGMVSYQTRRFLVDAVLHRAGLKARGVAAHAFRHAYARRFIELGGRLEELQKSLGHASIRTTEREYGHFHEDVAAEQARRRIYGDGLRLAK